MSTMSFQIPGGFSELEKADSFPSRTQRTSGHVAADPTCLSSMCAPFSPGISTTE